MFLNFYVILFLKMDFWVYLFCAGYTEGELWLADNENADHNDPDVVSLDELISGFMSFSLTVLQWNIFVRSDAEDRVLV